MTDFQAIMADFAVRQAERAAQAQSEIQRLKAAIIDPLRNAEIGLLCIEFFALLAQLLERITRARFGPGHQIVLSLAVGPLHARQCQHGAM